MATGLDLIGKDKRLQDHWLRRFAASIIDWVIIMVPFWVVFNLLGGALWTYGILMMGAAWILYSAVLEQSIGTTIGKSVMELGVMSQEGELTIDRAIIRNISKVQPVILLIDWLFGMVTEGEPRQRYLDRIAKTMVMHKSEIKRMGAHPAPPQPDQAVPAPEPAAPTPEPTTPAPEAKASKDPKQENAPARPKNAGKKSKKSTE